MCSFFHSQHSSAQQVIREEYIVVIEGVLTIDGVWIVNRFIAHLYTPLETKLYRLLTHTN
jgi:hypothetical protein